MKTPVYACSNATTRVGLLSEVRRADRLLDRMKGLLGCPGLTADQGLWIAPCKQAHTALMRFSLDIVFLDHELTVLKVYAGLPPWRLTAFFMSAGSALEAAAGSLHSRVAVGQRLRFVEQRN